MTEVKADAPPRGAIPEAVRGVLDDFQGAFDVHLSLWLRDDGEPGVCLYPDGADAGAMLIPNTVCKIAGAPHPKAADLLLDWILSKEVEHRLAQADGAQIPARDDVRAPDGIEWDPARIRVREVDWRAVARDLDDLSIQGFFKELFRS